MSFTSKNLQTTRRGGLSVLKGATLFFLGMSCVMFFTKAYLTITTEAINARQVIESIFLSEGGNPTATTGISLNGASGTAYFANKVGVGVEDSIHALDVAGDVKMNGKIYSDNDNTYIDFGQVGPIHKFEVGLSGDSFLNIFRYPSSSVFIIDPNNLGTNVGIGTSSPAEKLHINGNVVIDSITQTNKLLLGLGYSQISNSSEIYSEGDLYIKGPVRNNISGRSVYIQGGSTGTSYGKVILANEGGNVGIGTDTPLTKLHVMGIGDISNPIVKIGNSFSTINFAADGDYANIFGQSPIGGTRGIGGNDDYSSDAFTLGSLTNKDVIVFTNATERMKVTASGDVGIGTTSPTAKLHVDGNVKIGSNLSLYTDGFAYIESTNTLKFNTDGNSTKMTINGSGDVDIGSTPASDAKFDVRGRGKFSDSVQVGTPEASWCSATEDAGKIVYYVACAGTTYTPVFAGCVGSGASNVMSRTFLTGTSYTGDPCSVVIDLPDDKKVE